MALTRNPVRFDNPQSFLSIGGNLHDMGLTSPPTGFRTPDFTIDCQQKKGGDWMVRLQILQTAYEGTNTSYYLESGLHRSGLMLNHGALGNYTPGPGNREIYRNVTADIAGLSCRAEQEHCNDIIRAYQITLEAVENAISATKEAVSRSRKTYDKRSKAMNFVKQTLINQPALHPRLQKLFRDTINVNWNFDREKFRMELGDLYVATADLTSHRDINLWHTFGINRNHESWSAKSWMNYFRGGDIDIRDMTTTNIQIGITPSNAIINL